MDTIYLLKDSIGYYKIGFTKKPIESRIKSLHTSCSEDLEVIFEFKTNHKRKLETSLHNLFKHRHVKREFYDLSEEDKDKFINLCKSLESAYTALNEKI